VTLGAASTSAVIDLAGGTDQLNLADGTEAQLTVRYRLGIRTMVGNSGADALTLGAAQTAGDIDLGAGTARQTDSGERRQYLRQWQVPESVLGNGGAGTR